jgi:signal transduction histidine kinase
MNWHAVPVVIIAGITGYTAILFFGLYFALGRYADQRARREYLTFATTCLIVVAYDLVSAGLYNSKTSEQGIFWQHAQLFIAALLGIADVFFVWEFVRKPLSTFVIVACAMLGILGLMVGFWESPYTLTVARPGTKEVHAFSQSVVYYEGAAGILAQTLYIVFIVLYTAAIKQLAAYFISRGQENPHGRFGFLFAVVVSAIAAVNDILVSSGVYTFFYIFEYGLAAVWMSMGYILLMRFSALQQAVNLLNSDLSRTNADLVIALRQARASIQAKTEFLASISHELRTPLNSIINLPEGLLTQFVLLPIVKCQACGAEFQLEEGEVFYKDMACAGCGSVGLVEDQRFLFNAETNKAQSCLRTVANSGRHLLGLVNNILDASKLELGREVVASSSVDPRELINEVIASTQTLADKRGVSVRLQERASDAALGSIVADRVKIAQVLYNLIGNAIKFSPEGGLVEVSIFLPSRREIVICVRDHGIGIAKEHHEVIFEKFSQIDSGATRAYAGTGLGLAISRGLVELHGGRIWVESAKGGGASFFVRLPRVPPESERDDAVDSANDGQL